MKNLLLAGLFLAALAIVPNVASAGIDQATQVGRTLVQIDVNGSDTEWIPGHQINEVKKLAKFVDSYNKIVYRDDLSAVEKEAALTEAALNAFNQRSTTFKGLYCIKFSTAQGAKSPTLTMFIYPQTSFGYRFEISFTPQT